MNKNQKTNELRSMSLEILHSLIKSNHANVKCILLKHYPLAAVDMAKKIIDLTKQ